MDVNRILNVEETYYGSLMVITLIEGGSSQNSLLIVHWQGVLCLPKLTDPCSAKVVKSYHINLNKSLDGFLFDVLGS